MTSLAVLIHFIFNSMKMGKEPRYDFNIFYRDLRSIHDKSSLFLNYKSMKRNINSIEIEYSYATMVISIEKNIKCYKMFSNLSYYHKEEDESIDYVQLEKRYIKPYVQFLTTSLSNLPISKILPFREVINRSYASIQNGKKHVTVSLKTTGRCNENCYFCTQVLDGQNSSLEDILATIKFIVASERYRNFNIKDYIFHLSGGEPTTHPEFFKIFASFIENNFHFRVDTNGVNFSKSKYINLLKNHPKTEFVLSIHTNKSKTYDILTQTKGLFRNSITGMKNILKYSNGWTAINHLLTNENIDDFREFLIFYLSELRPIREHNVILFLSTMIMEDQDRFDSQVSYTRISQVLKANESFILENKIPLVYTATAWEMEIPNCIIDKISIKTETLSKEIRQRKPEPNNATTFIEKCKKCYLRNDCVGIQKSYLKKFGEKEFKPLSKTDFQNSLYLPNSLMVEKN